MTVAEIALAIMLVAGAGWLVRGFSNLRNINAGFNPTQRLIFDVTYNGPRYPNPPAVRAATDQMLTTIRGVSGVSQAGATSAYPMRGTLEGSLIIQFAGEALDPANQMGTRSRFVSPGLFDAMGIKLIEGRDVGPQDIAGTQAVAVINHVFATRYLRGRDPIGVQFAAGYPAPNPAQMVTIIGVIDDVRQKSLGEEAEPAFYQPLAQNPFRRFTTVVSTSMADPAALESPIRAEMRKLDPNMAVDFELARDVVSSTIRRQELGMTLMVIFGALAVVLAAVGIYGVVAYAGAQRRDEMATRLALGASPGSVFLLMLKQGGLLALAGTAIGLVLSYLSGKLVASQVYAVSASDPLMLSSAIVVVALITIAATMIPAWRAARLSPANALRPE
jgi:predicted permease